MRYYQDEALIQEIPVIKLGIVQAGESKEFTFWVYNDSRGHLRKVEFSINHPEVTIIKAPTKLNSQGKDKLVIQWKPLITLKEKLSVTIVVNADELFGDVEDIEKYYE